MIKMVANLQFGFLHIEGYASFPIFTFEFIIGESKAKSISAQKF